MRHVRKDFIILLVIVLVFFLVRMQVATETEQLSFDSYLTVRNVEHIHEKWTPLRVDPLSGARHVFASLFDYVLAIAVLLSPLMYKILPNLFMALTLVPIYFLAVRFTQSKEAAFVAVIIAGTAPVVLGAYINTPSAVPLALFLFFTILALLHDADKHVPLIVLLCIFLTFVSPVIFLLVLSLFATIILLRLESFGVDPRINECFFFTLLLSCWYYVLMYRRELFSHGAQVFWHGLMPSNLVFVDIINGIGVVTFLLGSLGVYHALFENREKTLFAIVGAIFAAVLLLALQAMPVIIGVLVLSLLLAVMASYGLMVSARYLARTRWPWSKYPILVALIFVFLISTLLPALATMRSEIKLSPTTEDVASYTALQKLPQNVTILTTMTEAAAVQYYGERRTVADKDLATQEMIDDTDAVFTSRFATTVVSKADKLRFTYVFFSRYAALYYGRDRLYTQNECMYRTNIGNAILYTISCKEEYQ